MPPKNDEKNDEKKEVKLTEEQIAEFQEAFELFDKDNDSLITSAELGTVMRALGLTPTDAELKELIATVDKDGNGKLDFAEFLALVASKGIGNMDLTQVRDAFRVFDKEDKGVISVVELRHILMDIGDKLTASECDQLITQVKTVNGHINYEEVIKLMNSK